MPRENIPEGEIGDARVFGSKAQCYYEMPGIVQAFYPGVAGVSPPSVDVQPAVHDVRLCVTPGVPAQPPGTPALVVGQRYSEPWPPLPKVPVRFPMGNGRAMWWALKKGDKVTLRAFDLDPSTFLATGQPSDPPLARRNSGTHWYAVAGDLTDGCALDDPGQAICIGTPGGVQVAIDGTKVNLGARAATDAVALASIVDSIMAAIKTHTHTSAAPGSPTSPSTQLGVPGVITPTGSATVKCQP